MSLRSLTDIAASAQHHAAQPAPVGGDGRIVRRDLAVGHLGLGRLDDVEDRRCRSCAPGPRSRPCRASGSPAVRPSRRSSAAAAISSRARSKRASKSRLLAAMRRVERRPAPARRPCRRGEVDRVHPALQRVEAAHQAGLGDHRRERDLGVVDAAFLQQQLDVVEARIVVGRVGGHRVLQLFQRARGVALGQRGLGGILLRLGLELVGAGTCLSRNSRIWPPGSAPMKPSTGWPSFNSTQNGMLRMPNIWRALRDLRLLVGVDLDQLEAAAVVDFQLFQHRAELLAGAAPWRPRCPAAPACVIEASISSVSKFSRVMSIIGGKLEGET